MNRRVFLKATAASALFHRIGRATRANGQRLAAAALAQVGVTVGYDPSWTTIPYPGGDVPRTTGVCADVIVRAARDGLGLDLQKLVHEDMAKHFSSYPARSAWGEARPDSNIDHRRVLNLQTYFERAGSKIWRATAPVPGNAFPGPLEVGDVLTWMLNSGQPHIGMVVTVGLAQHASVLAASSLPASLVHNIGRGAEETPLEAFSPHRAVGHYRWPAT